MQPDISIITPWLDHPEFINDYENAVRDPKVEVIAVDNGSASDAAGRISAMVQRLGGKYIRNEENHWFAAANNQGLAMARGSIVLFMNNDIAAQSGWLDQVRRDTQPGALFGPTVQRTTVDQLKIDYLEGWCIAGRQDVWHRLGGWNARSFQMPYWEDTELCIRAIRHGVRLMQTNWPVTHKKNGTSSDVPGVLGGLNHNRWVITSLMRNQPGEGAVPSQTVDPQRMEPVERYLETGRLPQAESAYRAAVAREPGRADLWLLYGQILRNCGRFEAATSAMNKAMELNPAYALAGHFEIGMSMLSMQRHAQAAEAFAKSVALKPDLAIAWIKLAIASCLCDRFEQAVDALNKAIAINPKDPEALVQLSKTLLQMGKKEEAKAAAEEAIRINAEDPSGHHALGSVLLEMNEPAKALESLDRAMALDPHNGMAHQQREQARAKLKDAQITRPS